MSNQAPNNLSVHSCCSPIACATAATPQLHPLQLLLPNCIDTLQLLLPVCVRFSCCSLIASASAAAHRLRPFQLLLALIASVSTAPRLCPLRLLLPDCIRFSCCSPNCIDTLQLLLPICVRFSCCSLLASASAAAGPNCNRFNYFLIESVSAAAPQSHPLQLQLTDCVRLDCCSPIASASSSGRFQPMPNVLEYSLLRVEFEIQ